MTDSTPQKHVVGVTQRTAPRGRLKEIAMSVHASSISPKTRVQFPGIFQAQFERVPTRMMVFLPIIFSRAARRTWITCRAFWTRWEHANRKNPFISVKAQKCLSFSLASLNPTFLYLS